jgi:hypothetical protein
VYQPDGSGVVWAKADATNRMAANSIAKFLMLLIEFPSQNLSSQNLVSFGAL